MPQRYWHLVYGAIQSGVTSSVAALIGTLRTAPADPLAHWLISWLLTWAAVMPVALAAAPLIRRLSNLVTQKSAREPQRSDG